MIAHLTAAMIAAHPPPFVPAWVDPSTVWALEADTSAAVALGALIGGYLGDVHPAWLVATAAVETGYTFEARATGDRGRSLGLCQIRLATSRQSLPWITRAMLLDPVFNIVAAGVHYGRLIHRYGRRMAQARYGCGFRCSGVTRGAKLKAAWFRQLTREVAP